MKLKEIVFNTSKAKIHVTSQIQLTPFTEFLIENFPDVQGLHVLDFGSGTGVLGIYASLKSASRVFCYDLNEKAIELTQKNILFNDLKNVSVLNLEEVRRRSIDIIISNPSSLPADSKINDFFDGGFYGNKMIDDLLVSSTRLLKDSGVLFFIHTSLVPFSLIEELLMKLDFNWSVINSKNLLFRPVYLRNLSHLLYLESRFPEVKIHRKGEKFYEEIRLIRVERIKR